jgi:hypothetical protein
VAEFDHPRNVCQVCSIMNSLIVTVTAARRLTGPANT